MNNVLLITVLAVSLSSAVVAGVCFTFSNFVMRALSQLSPSEGIAAMQSINIVVINPIFMVVFLGSGVLSAGLAWWAIAHWAEPSALYLLSGALLYIFGVLLVTGIGNVPLNEQLASVDPLSSVPEPLWNVFVYKWTLWNHARMMAAISAAFAFGLGVWQVAIGSN